MRRNENERRRRQSGAALLVAVIMLVLMGIIALSSMETVMRDRQVAGLQSQIGLALYAADAGLGRGFAVMRDAMDDSTWPLTVGALVQWNPDLPSGTIGDASDFPYGQPSYGPPPASEVPNPIDFMGFSPNCPEYEASINIANYGGGTGPKWAVTLWDVRAVGTSGASGTETSLQALAGSCQGFDQG